MNDIDDSTYRVTAKAVIRDPQGRVLLIHELSGDWGLPGGGVIHGEDPVSALARELHEEIGIQKVTSATLQAVHPYFSTSKNNWWLWLVYSVEAELPKKFTGELAQGVDFIDITPFQNSQSKAERRIYEALTPGVY